MSVSGFQNEKNISMELNNKRYSELNNNLKGFIKFIAEDKNIELNDKTIIKSNVITNNGIKPDIVVSISGEKFYISIKKGSGNSIHQEHISEFITYMDKLSASDIEKNTMRWFICSKEDSRSLKKNHPKKIDLLNKFLKKNKKSIITRVLKKGTNSENIPVDYIYYGDENEGVYANIDSAINKIISEDNARATLAVGTASLQAWNRTNMNKLETVQVKWTRIEKDLKEI